MVNNIKNFISKPVIKKITPVVLVAIVFIIALCVRALPLIKKGYVVINDFNQMTIARNLALDLGYKTETKDGVVLASSLVKESAMNAPEAYAGISYIYATFFKIFGFRSDNYILPMAVTVICHALVTVLLFIIVKRFFNTKVALIFALFDVLLPIFIQSSLMVGLYEFGSLFFTLGLLFYFLNKTRPGWIRILLAGIFFTLAVISRNAFLFSYGAFAIYDLYINRSVKKLLLFISPLVVLSALVFIYALPNNYGSTFIGGMVHESTPSFQSYGHFFPDPYTYHYDQTGFFAAGGSLGGYAEPFHNYGQKYSLKNYLAIFSSLSVNYISGFLDLIKWGGPLFAILFIFGCIYLYQQNKNLLSLLIIWLGVWFFSFVILTRTSNWTHYLELEFIVVLTISLGFYWVLNLLWNSSMFGKKINFILISTICLFAVLHFGQANRWMLHEAYTGDMEQAIETVAKYINTKKLTNKDVIAVGATQRMPYALNYFTDLNYVYFDPSTLDRLLSENRLKEAFAKYEVNKILGYTPDLTARVVKETGVQNLASHLHINEEKNVIIYSEETLESSL